ncbi:MAG: hypothetical protein M5U26_06355 [Planctomycetota bacterium]|nr:hypothetical protein [Planctomycetota bacterium]
MPQSSNSLRAWRALPALAVLGGLVHGAARWWVCDDAFIVFRYAKNLHDGLGLVYNAGERVEGCTNLLWVLWTSLAFVFGVAPETWTNLTSLACFAAVLAILGRLHAAWADGLGRPRGVPLAALALAAWPDACVYATNGLETSAFMLALVGGYALTLRAERLAAPARGLFLAGSCFGLGSLLRPDGSVPAFVAGLFVLWLFRPRVKAGAAFAAGFALCWIPAEAWRLLYYGEFYPNTYYAKSVNLAWYDQGLYYLRIYLERYWPLLFAPPLALLARRKLKREQEALKDDSLKTRSPEFEIRSVLFPAALAAVYAFLVVRAGGDFMFARLLVPVTPFVLLILDASMLALRPRPGLHAAAAGALILGPWAGILARPPQVEFGRGIVDERAFYLESLFPAAVERNAEALKRYTQGLDARILTFGTEARLAYRSEVPVSIEGHGLTDRTIARAPLERRTRPGHEKLPDPAYLLFERRVHFMFSEQAYFELLRLDRWIPTYRVGLGEAQALILTWDPVLMDELRRRGARVPDFLDDLDRLTARLGEMTDAGAGELYRLTRNFYFRNHPDPEREAPFKRRLGLEGPPRDGPPGRE